MSALDFPESRLLCRARALRRRGPTQSKWCPGRSPDFGACVQICPRRHEPRRARVWSTPTRFGRAEPMEPKLAEASGPVSEPNPQTWPSQGHTVGRPLPHVLGPPSGPTRARHTCRTGPGRTQEQRPVRRAEAPAEAAGETRPTMSVRVQPPPSQLGSAVHRLPSGGASPVALHQHRPASCASVPPLRLASAQGSPQARAATVVRMLPTQSQPVPRRQVLPGGRAARSSEPPSIAAKLGLANLRRSCLELGPGWHDFGTRCAARIRPLPRPDADQVWSSSGQHWRSKPGRPLPKPVQGAERLAALMVKLSRSSSTPGRGRRKRRRHTTSWRLELERRAPPAPVRHRARAALQQRPGAPVAAPERRRAGTTTRRERTTPRAPATHGPRGSPRLHGDSPAAFLGLRGRPPEEARGREVASW